jgi:hypothetical protein
VSASTPSRLPETHVTWRTWLLLLLASALSMGGYLLVSATQYHIGFPLDDAWIHQTYARNLATLGQWAFIPGQPSGGSTSPLWTVLLAGGYLLKINPLFWTIFLSGLLITTLGVMVEMGLASVVEGYQSRIPWAGLVVVFEWHFVWASLSGMETLLHAVVVLLVTLLLVRRSQRWLLIGLLAGLSTWIRPDGMTLLGPILLTAVCTEQGWKRKTGALGLVLLGFALLLVPYLFFNLTQGGKLLPTTFYAKQAEYAAWQARPLAGRAGELALQFLSGSAIILLPGVVLQVRRAVKRAAWGQVSVMIWVLGYIGIYLFRLPAYQHGRYLIPAMPVYFLLGLAGFLAFMRSSPRSSRRMPLIKFGWGTELALVCAGFWIMGLRSYQADVEFIESEMVATARWVAENIPEDALIAAHDIGALGYFDHHELVDLAGLITPQVISFFRDEEQLSNYLDQQGVDYLIVFPDWYPALSGGLIQVYTTGATYAPSVGETNMGVFKWPDQ